MKTMNKYSLILFATMLLFTTSCGEDFLERYPINSISKENFYKTPDDAESGLIAAYDGVQSFEYSCYIREVPDAFTDDCPVSSGDAPNMELNDFTFDATNLRIRNLFHVIYIAIGRVNVLLDGIENIDSDLFENNRKNEIIAEAKTLRAFHYFNLVRLWGNVPLVLSLKDDPFKGNTPKEEIYNAIINDLKWSIEQLPDRHETESRTRGTITKGAANIILADVYLTLGRWNEAVACANAVINSGVYNLLNNYDDLFNPNYENTEEAIFELQFSGPKEANGLASITLPPEIDRQWWKKYYLASDNLKDAFDEESDNTRLHSTIYFSRRGLHRWKTRDNGTGWFTSPQNLITYRLAYAYLVKAEALNEIGYNANGEAFNALNIIRKRVNLPEYTSTNLNNQEEFRNAVWKERRLELALEGFRWFDLLRTNRAIEVVSEFLWDGEQTLPEYKLLLPFPQEDLDVNPNLVQNPGW